MTHKERTLTTIDHEEPDRVPVCAWYTPEAEKKMLEYFGMDTSQTETYKSAGTICESKITFTNEVYACSVTTKL